jgi:hypothetical protein
MISGRAAGAARVSCRGSSRSKRPPVAPCWRSDDDRVKIMAGVMTEALIGALAVIWLMRWGVGRRA